MRPEDLASPRGSTNYHPTFVAALRHDRITAPFVIDRAMTSAIFIEYVRQCLVPALSPGDIVVDGQLAARGLSGMYLSAYRRGAIGLTPTQTAEVRRFVEASVSAGALATPAGT